MKSQLGGHACREAQQRQGAALARADLLDRWATSALVRRQPIGAQCELGSTFLRFGASTSGWGVASGQHGMHRLHNTLRGVGLGHEFASTRQCTGVGLAFARSYDDAYRWPSVAHNSGEAKTVH